MIESANGTSVEERANWVQTTLEEISEINPRPNLSNGNDDMEVTFLPMKAVEEMTGLFDGSCIRKLAEVKKGYTSFKNGDLLFAKITPCMENGKIAVVENLRNGIGFGSTEFHVIRLYESLPRKFFFFFLMQEDLRKTAQRSMTGSAGQLRVPLSYMKHIRIPFPPIIEQSRIVAKIEELFTKLDAGVKSLETVKVQLKRYRQSVLKSAFEGKLTEQWRRTHRDELEPTSKLLERIKEERRKGWEDDLRAKGKDPKKCKYREPEPVRLEKLTRVPEGWIWSSIGEIFQVGTGGTPRRDKPEYWNGGIPWVSSGEVAFCEVSRTKEQISELGMQNSNAKMHPSGTVLLALYGEGRTRGQAAILRIHASTNQAIAAILCPDSFIPSEYVYWWLYQRYEETRRTASGANQPNMYLRDVRMIPIPLAPLNEAIQIVSKIQQLFSSTEGTEKSIHAARQLADSLRQSILRDAFRGGFVPQDPSDEPASVLLEKIESLKVKSSKDLNAKRVRSRIDARQQRLT